MLSSIKAAMLQFKGQNESLFNKMKHFDRGGRALKRSLKFKASSEEDL